MDGGGLLQKNPEEFLVGAVELKQASCGQRGKPRLGARPQLLTLSHEPLVGSGRARAGLSSGLWVPPPSSSPGARCLIPLSSHLLPTFSPSSSRAPSLGAC